jgi:hypothetical protein
MTIRILVLRLFPLNHEEQSAPETTKRRVMQRGERNPKAVFFAFTKVAPDTNNLDAVVIVAHTLILFSSIEICERIRKIMQINLVMLLRK